MAKRLFLLGVVGLFLSLTVCTLAYAAITVTNQTGDVKITMPDGTQVLVSPGQAMPAIPDGSIIEVVSGSAIISTTGSSYVEVILGGDTVHLGAGDSINAGYDPQSGVSNVTLISGTAIVTKADGSTVTLDANNPSYTTGQETTPPPTPKPLDIGDAEEEIQVEESPKDISPSS